jgi:hypothetical protein
MLPGDFERRMARFPMFSRQPNSHLGVVRIRSFITITSGLLLNFPLFKEYYRSAPAFTAVESGAFDIRKSSSCIFGPLFRRQSLEPDHQVLVLKTHFITGRAISAG